MMNEQQKQQIQLLMGKFEEWLKALDFSPKSLLNYCGDVERFINWIEQETNVETISGITPQHLQQYQIFLYNTLVEKKPGHTKHLTSSTQRRKLASIRKFFCWLVLTQQIVYNPSASLQLPKSHRNLPTNLLTKAEAKILIETIPISNAIDLRDRSIIELLYATGIRKSELLNLSLYDLDLEQSNLFIKEGKRKDSRIIPLTTTVSQTLNLYLSQSRPTFTKESIGCLFVSSKSGGKLDVKDIERIVKKWAKRAKIKKHITPHSFRHSFATHMLAGKADIRQIQKLLGHRRLSSTEFYTQLEVADLRQALELAHPRANKKL